MTINYFCVYHKNRRKHNTMFQTAFFQNKFILWHIKLKIYIWKNKFASLKQYLFGPLFLVIQRWLVQIKVYYKFLTLPERKYLTNFQKQLLQKSFCAFVCYICTTSFAECFLPMWWLKDVIFYTSSSLPRGFLLLKHVAFFETSVLKEVRVLFPLSL